MKKSFFILAALIGFGIGVNAQMSSTVAVGTKAFEILQSLSNASQQQFGNHFLTAKQIYEKKGGDANELSDYYKTIYNTLLNSGIVWSKVQFVAFNAGTLDKDNFCGDSTLVFSYQNTKYYVKLGYFLYNSKYYLLTIRGGVKVYPF